MLYEQIDRKNEPTEAPTIAEQVYSESRLAQVMADAEATYARIADLLIQLQKCEAQAKRSRRNIIDFCGFPNDQQELSDPAPFAPQAPRVFVDARRYAEYIADREAFETRRKHFTVTMYAAYRDAAAKRQELTQLLEPRTWYVIGEQAVALINDEIVIAAWDQAEIDGLIERIEELDV